MDQLWFSDLQRLSREALRAAPQGSERCPSVQSRTLRRSGGSCSADHGASHRTILLERTDSNSHSIVMEVANCPLRLERPRRAQDVRRMVKETSLLLKLSRNQRQKKKKNLRISRLQKPGGAAQRPKFPPPWPRPSRSLARAPGFRLKSFKPGGARPPEPWRPGKGPQGKRQCRGREAFRSAKRGGQGGGPAPLKSDFRGKLRQGKASRGSRPGRENDSAAPNQSKAFLREQEKAEPRSPKSEILGGAREGRSQPRRRLLRLGPSAPKTKTGTARANQNYTCLRAVLHDSGLQGPLALRATALPASNAQDFSFKNENYFTVTKHKAESSTKLAEAP